jgi:hypothetical protein
MRHYSVVTPAVTSINRRASRNLSKSHANNSPILPRSYITSISYSTSLGPSHCISFGILNTRKYDVSETASI